MRWSFEDLVFKRRTLFVMTADEFRERETTDIRIIQSPDDMGEEERSFLDARHRPGTAWRRLESGECHAIVSYDHDIPVGHYWALAPKSGARWHDSFRVEPGEGLLFNAFVEEGHRKRGHYRKMQDAAHMDVLIVGGCERAFTIVEDSNIPSIEANRSFGLRKEAENQLIKFLGRNVLSIFRYDHRTNILFVLFRRKGEIP